SEPLRGISRIAAEIPGDLLRCRWRQCCCARSATMKRCWEEASDASCPRSPDRDADAAEAYCRPRSARWTARRSRTGRTELARDSRPVVRTRDCPQGRAAHRDDATLARFVSCATSLASTSQHSPRSTPNKCASFAGARCISNDENVLL